MSFFKKRTIKSTRKSTSEKEKREFIENIGKDENFDVYVDLNDGLVGCHVAFLIRSLLLKTKIKELVVLNKEENIEKNTIDLKEHKKEDFKIVKKWMYGETSSDKEMKERFVEVYKIADKLNLEDMVKYLHMYVINESFSMVEIVLLLYDTFKKSCFTELFMVLASMVKNDHEKFVKDDEVKKLLLEKQSQEAESFQMTYYFTALLQYEDKLLSKKVLLERNHVAPVDLLLINHVSKELANLNNRSNRNKIFELPGTFTFFYMEKQKGTFCGYRVFKVIFSNRCEYYNSLLYGGFKESKSHFINIGFESELFNLIRKYLHFKDISDDLQSLSLSTLEKMLRLSDKLQILELWKKCIEETLVKMESILYFKRRRIKGRRTGRYSCYSPDLILQSERRSSGDYSFDENYDDGNSVNEIDETYYKKADVLGCFEILEYVKDVLSNFGNLEHVEEMKNILKEIEKKCFDFVSHDKEVSLKLIHEYFKTLEENKKYHTKFAKMENELEDEKEKNKSLLDQKKSLKEKVIKLDEKLEEFKADLNEEYQKKHQRLTERDQEISEQIEKFNKKDSEQERLLESMKEKIIEMEKKNKELELKIKQPVRSNPDESIKSCCKIEESFYDDHNESIKSFCKTEDSFDDDPDKSKLCCKTDDSFYQDNETDNEYFSDEYSEIEDNFILKKRKKKKNRFPKKLLRCYDDERIKRKKKIQKKKEIK